MNAARLLTALTVLVVPVTALGDDKEAQTPELGEVIVADRIRGAFYEDAPRSVARSMKKAVSVACADAKENPPKDKDGNPIDIAPLCDGRPIRYLREVLISGEKLEEGYICLAEDFERFKYFPIDMPAESGCVNVSYDYESKTHSISIEDLD